MLYYAVKVYIPEYWSSYIYTRELNLRTQQKITKKKINTQATNK